MHSMLISGGLMVVMGTFLIMVPLIRWAVGPILFLIGGLTCLAGMILK